MKPWIPSIAVSNERVVMRSTSLIAFSLVLVACGTDAPEAEEANGVAGIGGAEGSGSSEEGGVPTGEGEGDAAGTTSGAGSSTSAGVVDESGGDGPKFDVPTSPDAGNTCGGSGDGDGSGTFSNIWVANAPEGTVSKIDTDTAMEVARYRTTTVAADQPSRTSVNQFGDIAAGHRFAARVIKIAAEQEDCVDTNGNAQIDTSTGSADILDWGTDECVLWEADLLPAHAQGTRAVAWEGGIFDPETCENTNPNPRLWVAYGSNPLQVKRLDGATGAVLDETTVPSSGFVYGGAVNGEGDFWVSDRSGSMMHRVDGLTLAVDSWPVPGSNAYGMGVDGDGQPWIATYESGAGVDLIYRFDPIAEMWHPAGGITGRYRGLAIDRDDRVWVAGNSPCRLAVFDRLTDSVIDDAIALPGCADPVGVTIDRDGFVWVVDRGSSVAWKVDPETSTVAATVTGLNGPYTYSDFSGSGLDLVINPPG